MSARPLQPETIPHAVARAAAVAPDHPALRMVGKELSYLELDRQSNQVANVLRSAGVRRGDRVGLYAHKSIEVLVAMHGVMKAGAAYVPINPDAPEAYVRQILEDCGIRHVVAGRSTARVVRAMAGEVEFELCMGVVPEAGDTVENVAWEKVWDASTAAPDAEMTADDLAYVIFTSGSTGRPKGIMHTHRSGLAYATVAAATYGFEARDRITNHAPLNFDLSTLELFGGLVAGATVVIIPEAHARLPASFTKMLEDEEVTVVNAVPFALIQMLHRGALDDRDLSRIRWVLFGGEVFPTRDLRALMSRLPGARFANVYGPAEVNGVTYYVVPDLPADCDEPISIGSLYEGMEALVVDGTDRPVPDGDVGELLIHSPTHMLGYWNQPDVTELRRLRRPRADGGEDVFYRTGDLVARGPDGRFRFVGRKDRQVKMRGHRIELDEVETALIGHADVEQAVVYAVPDGEGSQRIEAVVTLFDSAATTVDEPALRAHVSRRLPRYAVPHGIRIVADVPRTTTGKADRVALVAEATRLGAHAGRHD